MWLLPPSSCGGVGNHYIKSAFLVCMQVTSAVWFECNASNLFPRVKYKKCKKHNNTVSLGKFSATKHMVITNVYTVFVGNE